MSTPLAIPLTASAPAFAPERVTYPDPVQPHGERASTPHPHLERARWLLVVRGEPLLKRALDVLGAVALLSVAWPVLALAALLVKLTDGGPVLFWQKRVGRDGRHFDFPKLRSMIVNAERARPALEQENHHRGSVTFKMRRDPRVTWIGRIIRKLSIDELPQLWCVLGGDMSLVGPRPALPSEVRRYSCADRRRLDVTPGLTCLWQVSGRGDLPFETQVRLDVDYILSRSFALDLRILAATVPAVLTGAGAY